MLSQNEIRAKANQYFDLCISSDYAREQQVLHVITEPNVIVPFKNSASLMDFRSSIKLEHFESFDQEVWDWCKLKANSYKHRGPVTAHIFIAPAGGYTFHEHTDPDHVLICVVEGEKTMVVEGVPHHLKAGDTLYIPADVKHYAVNEQASIMISLGFEKWLVEKL